MLAVAARAEPGVRWFQGQAESLPLPDGCFDHVFCQFGLMFFADRQSAVTEMARVARRGANVCVTTWAGLAETPGYAALIDLLDKEFGPAPARALAAPFNIGTSSALEEILSPVFDGFVVRRLDGVARFPSVDAWVTTDVRAWTLRDLLDDKQLAALRALARVQLREFCDRSGRVSFPAPALVAHVRRRCAMPTQ